MVVFSLQLYSLLSCLLQVAYGLIQFWDGALDDNKTMQQCSLTKLLHHYNLDEHSTKEGKSLHAAAQHNTNCIKSVISDGEVQSSKMQGFVYHPAELMDHQFIARQRQSVTKQKIHLHQHYMADVLTC